MKYNKNENTKVNTKKSNVKKDNNIASSLTKREQPGKIDIPNSNDALFDFEINEEFMEENIKNNLVRARHNHTQKFAPFTRSQRRKGRIEVYRLHFEKGIQTIRVADMMNVDRKHNQQRFEDSI